jgi:putative two-component system hydrogenase maturation factor HypX/HoxX
MGSREAVDIGLIDAHYGCDPANFLKQAVADAQGLAEDGFEARLHDKLTRRDADECRQPLAAYRAEEMARMRLNFYGFDASYHVARHNFVRKIPKARTPLYLARHRAHGRASTTPPTSAVGSCTALR